MFESHHQLQKASKNFGFRCFFVVKTLKMVWVKMWVNRLTHTVTHIGISGFAAYCQLMPHGYNEMRGKNQRAPERKLLPFRCSACLRDLSNLRHEAAHFLRGLLLHLSCGVGVGSQGESRVVVTEH